MGILAAPAQPAFAQQNDYLRCYNEGFMRGQSLQPNTNEARDVSRCFIGELRDRYDRGYTDGFNSPQSPSNSNSTPVSGADSNLVNILRQNGLFTVVPCNSTNVVNVVYSNGNNICAAPAGRFGPGSYFIGSDYGLYPVGINSGGVPYAPNVSGPVPVTSPQQQPFLQQPPSTWGAPLNPIPVQQPPVQTAPIQNLNERW